MRVLTKSRFKLGLECPNKLFYTKKKEYANQKKEDPFLQALAEGGFQVEELARMQYPGGILLEGKDWDYEFLWARTQELLQQENIVIYEPAFLIDDLFIRVDILVKKGYKIELMEVKSKSYDPDDAYLFVGKKGGLKSGWKPYMFDVAFQKHVMQLCYPEWDISSFIMMANKQMKASVDGLNQMFRIKKNVENRTGIIKLIDSVEELGNPVLGRKNVDEVVSRIISDQYLYHNNMGFLESVQLLKDCYLSDRYFNWPTSFQACKACEFKTTEEDEQNGLKSGFAACFSKQHNWSEKEFKKPNIFDIWDFRAGNKLFDQGIVFKEDLTLENIKYKEEAGRLSRTGRQWLQIEKDLSGDESSYLDVDGLQEEMSAWNYPLHFIDFETSTVALPFNKGRHPYEQVAFQFSHHIYHKDGSIEHASEYINSEAGFFPNFEFIRELKKVLENDTGTIFRYAPHENTIVNAIYRQLIDSNEFDKEELMAFIQSISHSTNNSAVFWEGERDMVDLWDVVKKYYYNPYTKGSNSIKDVLPAVLNSSEFLQEKYSQNIGSINLTSMNFGDNHIWLKIEKDELINPYKMLPPVFDNWTEDEIERSLSEITDIDNGGAALTAYGKMQFTDMSENERQEITDALLKYCELDTLAMVMIFEFFEVEVR